MSGTWQHGLFGCFNDVGTCKFLYKCTKVHKKVPPRLFISLINKLIISIIGVSDSALCLSTRLSFCESMLMYDKAVFEIGLEGQARMKQFCT